MTFSAAKLGDVADFIRGITFKPDDVVQVGESDAVVCMRTKNVQALLDCDDLLAVPSQFVRRKQQYLEEGDILVSSANSWNLVGKCCWVPNLPWRASFGGFVSVLRGDLDRVDRRYLYWWFASDRIQALLRSFGQKTTNISNLNIDRCLKLDLPLPPLPAQRRIAAILDKADALRTNRREALAQLDRLAQSIFVEMFGDPVTNSKRWPKKQVAELCELINGRAFKPEEWEESGLPIIRIQNLNDARKPFNYTKKTLSDRYRVSPGDILFSWSGTPGTSFGCFRWRGPVGWLNQHIFNVRLSGMDGDFFIHQMNLKLGELIAKAHGGVGLQHVTKKMVDETMLICPPALMQQEFSKAIKAMYSAQSTVVASGSMLDSLFASLQRRAFKGEL